LKYAVVRIGIGALLLPALAAAHPIEGVGDFYSGMLHPLLALDQIVPMIALSLLAGQQERRTAARLLGTFPAALVAGACAFLIFHPPPFYVFVNMAAMVVFGLLVVMSRRFPALPLIALTAVLGFFQGLPVGAEIQGDVAPWRFIPGAGLTALIVIAYGVGLVRWLNEPWAKIAVRVTGSWVAATGIMVLALK
jgi:urease accessory protein